MSNVLDFTKTVKQKYDDRMEHAFAWGRADATNGAGQCGEMYFSGQCLASYNDGHACGCAELVNLAGTAEEIAQMADDLRYNDLRANDDIGVEESRGY